MDDQQNQNQPGQVVDPNAVIWDSIREALPRDVSIPSEVTLDEIRYAFPLLVGIVQYQTIQTLELANTDQHLVSNVGCLATSVGPVNARVGRLTTVTKKHSGLIGGIEGALVQVEKRQQANTHRLDQLERRINCLVQVIESERRTNRLIGKNQNDSWFIRHVSGALFSHYSLTFPSVFVVLLGLIYGSCMVHDFV